MYRHILDGQISELPVGKAVCVGRNYLDHIRELGNEVPAEPLLFIKPNTAMVTMQDSVVIPTQWGECHNELEVALLIDKPLGNAAEASAMQAIGGVGLALDLTLRDVQDNLKKQGQPWERAKAFDGACPLSPFISAGQIPNLDALCFSLEVDGAVRQQGDTSMMMRRVATLLSAISQVFTLLPGDVVLTGTPAGVAPLRPGQHLRASLADKIEIETRVIARD
ncbi:fumarylacetoacetate hydrolase family protein [Bowmanella sp. JS7-9]|uniref:Fumarylacetoacetate hydrolase family protein n=1 Tax=Pseudobowmanella zhangzhouensis TaxID=1537679 RepID=A0ABW1XJR5_9ALTE|nr:fumarylacetoacetate hydrolase family protein [Bowmanella sp. JS7-9]TBX25726.1 5-carboxymethyl-2-hydroxymuconate delta-isomerase [Bowmanella sp. JS7-9]